MSELYQPLQETLSPKKEIQPHTSQKRGGRWGRVSLILGAAALAAACTSIPDVSGSERKSSLQVSHKAHLKNLQM